MLEISEQNYPLADRPKFRPLSPILAIVYDIAERHGVDLEDIIGPSRAQPFMLIRQEAMYFVIANTNFSICAIGRRMRRNHSTVIHNVSRYCSRMGLPLPRTTQWARYRRFEKSRQEREASDGEQRAPFGEMASDRIAVDADREDAQSADCGKADAELNRNRDYSGLAENT